tara:strand:- start:45 stop:890 length:846 start_codon:yes stop_codon:yes gene_type:complete
MNSQQQSATNSKMNTEMSNAEKWRTLVKWIEDTDGDEDADIWNFLGEDLGVEPDGSRGYGPGIFEDMAWRMVVEQKKKKEEECDCGCLDDEEDEEEYDTLDMKVLGFNTTERLDGNWHSLLFEIRNYGDDEEDDEDMPILSDDEEDEDEEINGIMLSRYFKSLNEEFCVYCDKKENLHFVDGSSTGGYYSCGCDEEEEEKDVCEGCEKEVVVEYEDYKGYTIANCENCTSMLCRECLESGTADMCKYCVVGVVEKFAENLNSYPKENVDRIIAMMKEDMLE